MAKETSSSQMLEALYPRRALETKISPFLPPILRAADLLGASDTKLAQGCSLMGNPPLYFQKPRPVQQAHISDFRKGKRKMPLFTRAKITAYLEFAAQELKRLEQQAGIPSTGSVWSDITEAEGIIAQELKDPEISALVQEYRRGFAAIFHGSEAGRRFLREQEKIILELVGKHH